MSSSASPPGAPEGEQLRRSTSEDLSNTRSKKKTYYGRTARVGALWTLLRRGGQELIAIPTSIIMARLLVPEEFGVAAASSFFILLASRLTQFGFNAAIVRVKELRPDHTESVFVVNLVAGVFMWLTIAAGAPYIGQFLRSADAGKLLPHAAIIFLITPFGTVPSALITRRMNFHYSAIADWLDAITAAAVSVVLAMRGFSYWSLVYGQLAGAAVLVTAKLYFAGWRPSLRASRSALSELLSFGLGVQTKRLLEFATNNLDTLVVGRVLGMTALGIYDKAFTTMNRIVSRLTLGEVYFRIFSIIHEEPRRFRLAYSRLVLTVSVIGVPAFAAAIVIAQPLFLLMYGERWQPAVLPFQLLCVGGILRLFNAYASQANEATGNIWAQTQRQAIGVVCLVAGVFVGSRMAGVAGAAAGVAFGLAVMTVAIQALVRRTTGLTWGEMLRPQLPALTCAVLVVAAMLAVSRALPLVVSAPATWQFLVAEALAGGIVYAGFILFTPFDGLAEIVSETLHQLLPPRIADPLNRVRQRRSMSVEAAPPQRS
jgi:PST family polysaccharide transporter